MTPFSLLGYSSSPPHLPASHSAMNPSVDDLNPRDPATLGTKPQHVSPRGQGHARSKTSQSLNALWWFVYGGPVKPGWNLCYLTEVPGGEDFVQSQRPRCTHHGSTKTGYQPSQCYLTACPARCWHCPSPSWVIFPPYK